MTGRLPPVDPGDYDTLRAIRTCYPPIDLFEDLTLDPLEWQALIALEMLTNPRIRDETGDISLVAPEDRVSGDGASVIMAAFTHPPVTQDRRFNRIGTGAYYAALSPETAIREVAYHLQRELEDFGAAADDIQYRLYKASIHGPFADIKNRPMSDPVYSPEDYSASNRLADSVRGTEMSGLIYNSVRHPGGVNIACFRPRRIGRRQMPIQTRHINIHWNGSAVTHWFDYQTADQYRI